MEDYKFEEVKTLEEFKEAVSKRINTVYNDFDGAKIRAIYVTQQFYHKLQELWLEDYNIESQPKSIFRIPIRILNDIVFLY